MHSMKGASVQMFACTCPHILDNLRNVNVESTGCNFWTNINNFKQTCIHVFRYLKKEIKHSIISR